MVRKKLETYRRKLSEASKVNKIIAVGVALVVLVAGFAVLRSMAATPFASLEAEDSSRQGPATVVNDDTASNNSALKFGEEPVPDTTPPPDSEITHGSQLTLSHVGPSGQLTPSGSITTSHNGQVIENVEVTGTINVQHQDVLIRNVRVLVTSRYGVQVPLSLHSTASFRLENSEVRGVSGDRSACVVHYGKWTIKRSLISNCLDGVKIGTGHHIIESIITEPYYLPSGSHNDGIQSVGGSNSSVIRSRVDGPFKSQTSALILQTNLSGISNYRLESNYLSGGNYTLYIRDKGNGHGAPTNMTVIDNIWEQDSWQFGQHSLNVGSGWVWENNRTTTGTPVTCGSCN